MDKSRERPAGRPALIVSHAITSRINCADCFLARSSHAWHILIAIRRRGATEKTRAQPANKTNIAFMNL